MKKSVLHIAIVTCMAASGYRRANVGFEKGENELKDITSDQLEVFDKDPRLKIIKVEEVKSVKSPKASKATDAKVEDAKVEDAKVEDAKVEEAKVEEAGKE
jgi:hypothetical protein